MMIEHNNGGTSCSSDSNGSNKSYRCANNYIPDDLIIEVLSRLPDRTLVRFMCVSKSWRNLIANSLRPSPMSGLLLWGLSRKYSEEFPDAFIPLLPLGSNCLEALQSHSASLRTCHPEITVIDYCNGLFLFSNKRWNGTTYYVCNPATNQCVALPEPPPFSCSCRHYVGSAFIFDPRKSSHYKVLRTCHHFYRCSKEFEYEVQIFSSDKNQWVSLGTYLRTCTNGSDHSMEFWYHPFIHLNGALYFLCCFSHCMISFYVEEKRFRESELPNAECEHHIRRTQRLGESEGRLYYVACHYDVLKIWMLQSLDPDKWFKKHTVCIANFGKALSPSNGFFSIMAFHRDLEVFFIRQRGVIFSYYFGSGRKDIDRLEEVCSIDPDVTANFVIPYSPCLISLKDVCNRRSS